MISLEQYRRVVGLYASSSGALIRDTYTFFVSFPSTSSSSSAVNHRQFLTLLVLLLRSGDVETNDLIT